MNERPGSRTCAFSLLLNPKGVKTEKLSWELKICFF